MNMVKGKVSCIIPTYKRSDTLVRAINSVLNQTYKNIEVIVVDDNEPNDRYSLEVQKKISIIEDPRLRYLQQEKHLNGAVARNVGIKEANGEFIAFLDDDDEWDAHKTEKQLELLSSNPNCSGVSCLYYVYSNGRIIRKCPCYTGEGLHRKVLERSVAVCTPTVLLKREALDKAGYFDESLIRHQDLQLLLDFLYENKFCVLNEYMVNIYADSKQNKPNTKRIIEIKNDFFRIAEKHLNRYSRKEQKSIKAAHYFEIILVALKEKKIAVVLKYICKVGLNLKAYIDVMRRYSYRKNSNMV